MNASSIADRTARILLPALRWFINISAAPAFAPVVADGFVFLSLKPGIVSAHRIADGSEAWRVPLVADEEPASAPDLLLVPAAETVRALAATTGREIWLAPTGTITAPLLVKSGWVIAATERTVFALRAADGTEVWKRDAGEVRQRPAIDGDTLYVSFVDGRVAALDLSTGTSQWEQKIGGSGTAPLVWGDRVYVGCSDKKFYALFRKNGELDWASPVGAALVGRAAADDTRIYLTAMDNLLRALDRTSGALRWRRDLPFRPVAGPVVIGESVMVPGSSADLQLFDTKSGEPRKTLALDSPLAIAPGFGVEPGESLASIAAVTGNLNEQWKLWLYGPLPPAPDGPSTGPLTALPGRSAPPGL